MSGIFGHWWLDGRPAEVAVGIEMSRRLEHRGPDGSGDWSAGPVSLGHRMLRATPEARSEIQPLNSSDGALVLTADVRLDNRDELIAALGLRRSPGQDPSDPDLLLDSYQKWGEQCVERWIGDFAVAIWDSRRRRLFCARDPFGLKPFYYHFTPGRLFAFASEVEALFALREVPDSIHDFEVARHLLVPLGRDASSTYHTHIRRLPPANALVVSEGGLEIRGFWRPDPTRELKLSSDAEYAEALREAFVESVRCRIRSPTPVAAMLSGGIDSAAIACVAADLLEREGQGPLHVLSAVYPDVASADERAFIETVLRRQRMVAHSFSADRVNPVADIDRVNRLVGGAHWGSNLYLNWVLYGAAAEAGAKVVLDGFDGDTTVSHGLGYLSELAMTGRWLRLAMTSVPYSRRQGRPAISDFLSWVRLGIRHATRPTPLVSLARGLRRNVRNGPSPSKDESNRHSLLNPDFAREFSARVVSEPHPPMVEREFHLRKLQGLALFEGIGWLEACAAGRGIEVRLPFCDVRLVELCLSFPPEQKIRRGWTRYAMRRAMQGILPEAIRWRPDKTNLHPGWARAWRSTENGRIEALMANPRPIVTRYLDTARVLDLHRRFMAGNTDESQELALWRALSLALWLSARSD